MPLNSLTYNGIELQGISIRQCNRQSILNGPDYLYTMYELHVRGVYNAAWPGVDGSPPLFDDKIRAKLAQPHKSLYVHLNNGITPRAGAEAVVKAAVARPYPWIAIAGPDANNGPEPIGPPSIVQIVGTKTWMIDFGIRFFINECGEKPFSDITDPSVLLSNRWDQAQVLDQQYYTAMRVSGRAVFRSDLLAKRQITADQLRSWLLLPVPNGFKREQLNVSQSQDGVAIRYEFTDLQKSVNVNHPDVADCEIYMNLGTAGTGFLQATWDLAEKAARDAGELAQAVTSVGQNGTAGVVGAVPGYLKYANLPQNMALQYLGPMLREGGGRAGLALSLAGRSPAVVPETQFNAKVVVYGTPHASLGSLVAFAVGVMSAKMPYQGSGLYGTQAHLSINAHRRIVTLEYTIHLAPAMMLAAAITANLSTFGESIPPAELDKQLQQIDGSVDPNALRSIDASSKFWTNQSETLAYPTGQTVLAGPYATFSNAPKPNAVYGSHPVNLITAALLGSCGVPANAAVVNVKSALLATTPTGK